MLLVELIQIDFGGLGQFGTVSVENERLKFVINDLLFTLESSLPTSKQTKSPSELVGKIR